MPKEQKAAAAPEAAADTEKEVLTSEAAADTEKEVLTSEAAADTGKEVLTSEDTKFADLAEKEAALDAKEIRLNAKEEDLEKREAALAKSLPREKTPGLAFKFEGQKYKFADNAPKEILLSGKKRTQKEIAEDEDLALLVVGLGIKSGLIKKIK